MSKLPLRPSHTGTARAEALRQAARQERTPRPPTHAVSRNAAVALGDLPQHSAVLTRRARRPLVLEGGRQALALRQAQAGPLQILVRQANGSTQWDEAKAVVTEKRLRAWVQEGFGPT